MWVPYSELRLPLHALRLLETLKSGPDCADDDDSSTSRSVCSFDEVQSAAAKLRLRSRRASIGHLLRIFSGMGALRWFPEVDPSLVVLDSQWLMDSMAALIREHEGEHSQLLDHLKRDKQAIPLLQEAKVRRGIFPVDLLNFIWSSDKAHYGALNGRPDEIRALKRILEHSGLICRIQMREETSDTRQEYYVVPSLLPKLPSHVVPDVRISNLMAKPDALRCTCTWDFSHSEWLPDHVFERLACTVVASREDLSLHEKILACDVMDISSGGAIMLLRLDRESLCIKAETVNYDACPHNSRWMYKTVQAAMDRVLPQLRTDDSRRGRRPSGIYKVRLSTTDGKDNVELSKLRGSRTMVGTVSGATVRLAPLQNMWLNDPHGCDGDCCSQTLLSSAAMLMSPSMPPPLPPSKNFPFSRVRAGPA